MFETAFKDNIEEVDITVIIYITEEVISHLKEELKRYIWKYKTQN